MTTQEIIDALKQGCTASGSEFVTVTRLHVLQLIEALEGELDTETVEGDNEGVQG